MYPSKIVNSLAEYLGMCIHHRLSALKQITYRRVRCIHPRLQYHTVSITNQSKMYPSKIFNSLAEYLGICIHQRLSTLKLNAYRGGICIHQRLSILKMNTYRRGICIHQRLSILNLNTPTRGICINQKLSIL